MTPAGRDRLVCLGRFRAPRRLSFFAAWLLPCLLIVTGCTSPNVYRAAETPGWLQAQPIANAKTLDLSRLAGGSYTNDLIDREDVLEININASLDPKDNVTIPTRVNEAGFASLPVVGDVPVLGLDLPSAEAAITAAAVQRGVYRSPHVTVSMKRQHTVRVTLVGAVKDPGVKHLAANSSDLFAALVAGGGFADDAGTNVEVRNPPSTAPVSNDRIANGTWGPSNIAQAGHSQNVTAVAKPAQAYRVDLVSATRAGAGAYPLQDGAIVMVERRDLPAINVIGLVHKPGSIDFPVNGELHVLDAIGKAGGVSNQLSNKIFVIRQPAEQSEPSVIQVSIYRAKRNGDDNIRLAPGDIVSVEQTPGTVLLETVKLIRLGLGASLGTIF